MSTNSIYRLSVFIGIFFIMLAWEFLFPKRALTMGRTRWFGNLGITLLNTLISIYFTPFLPVATAALSAERGWGVMNQIRIPEWAAFIIGIVALDMVIYMQHAMFHGIPVLRRLHMMHHADHDIDVTTGLRFHPIEILISLFIKLGAVLILGVPAFSVLVFEIILNGMSMFNHGNVRISGRIDRLLRLFVVTPDMHRVHHSVAIDETNSNFGFSLSWWDFLFGTYKDQPSSGHEKMTIGTSHLRELKWQSIFWMIMLPFMAKTGPYPLGRHGRVFK